MVAVFTAADIPGELRVGIIHKDWPVLIPEGGRTSYAGDVLAIVVAETRQQARAAAALVEVDYDVLRPLTDPVAAVDDPEIAVWGTDSQRCRVSEYARGDVDAALAAERPRPRGVPDPAHRARLPRARVDAGRARRRRRTAPCTCTRAARACGTTATRSPRCSASSPSRVTVELVSNGGAFGGKEDMANQAQTALAAWLLQRPGEVHALARGEPAASTPSATRSGWSTGSAATPTAG